LGGVQRTSPFEFIICWAHLNARLLPVGHYRTTIERYEAREPLGWSQRIYELGTMWSIAHYAGDFSELAVLKDERSKLPEYQPLAELILHGPVDETLVMGGLWPGHRLIMPVMSVSAGRTVEDGGLGACWVRVCLESEFRLASV